MNYYVKVAGFERRVNATTQALFFSIERKKSILTAGNGLPQTFISFYRITFSIACCSQQLPG
jgi:hypothetical protein